ncbi:MAG: hypothetical protein ITD49_02220, partial [Candidatus Nitrotoga sp.]|nr:hypothetical protein [Candidatus Nitrotoga sp.]
KIRRLETAVPVQVRSWAPNLKKMPFIGVLSCHALSINISKKQPFSLASPFKRLSMDDNG